MTYREPANASPAPVRPPPILGFAFYLVGTGCLAMGVSAMASFVHLRHRASLGQLQEWSSLIGQVMVLVGLAVAWRATRANRGTTGFLRRMLGASATLWLTLMVVEHQRAQLQLYFLMHAPAASMLPHAAQLVGQAIAFAVIAMVAHTSGRVFASRTWATTLGAALVFADSWAEAWALGTRMSFDAGARLLAAVPSFFVGGVGLVLTGGGLFAAGANILRGITIDEYLRAHPRSASDGAASTAPAADRPPLLLRGLPLFVEGLIALAGLAFVHAASVGLAPRFGLSAHDVSDTVTLGGELVAWTVVSVAAYRMRSLLTRSYLVGVVLAVIALDVAVRYLLWSRGAFSAAGPSSAAELPPFVAGARALLTITALHAVTLALDGSSVLQMTLKRHLRLASSFVGASLLVSLLASFTFVARDPLQASAAVFAAIALYVAIGAAGEARRIVIALSR